MNRKTFGRLALALFLALLLPALTFGCGGSKADDARDAAGAKAAMEKGAAPTGNQGQTFQAAPAPPP